MWRQEKEARRMDGRALWVFDAMVTLIFVAYW
jgi:hypothetical protein